MGNKVDSGYPNEWKESSGAALVLASMRHEILDDQTRRSLNKLIETYVPPNKIPNSNIEQNQSTNPQEPAAESILDADYSPPDIPQVPTLNGLIERCRCSKPFQKQLTVTDLKADQCRLSLNKVNVQEFLIPLLKEDEDLNQGIPVDTYDLRGKKYTMMFKLWCSKYYVLTSGWTEFHQQNNLKAHDDFITIWMFRHVQTDKLCFVIGSRRSEVPLLPLFHTRKAKKIKQLGVQ